MMTCAYKKRTSKIVNPIRCCIYDSPKEDIETKWQKITTREETKPPVKPASVPLGAKVIRRRKGHKDAPVSCTP